MKRLLSICLALLLLTMPLMGCASEKKTEDTAQTQTVHGIINKIDNYLVLLLEDGEHQIMDYGEGVVMDGFEEGDSVDVTYTGKLGVENENPVITAITKAQ